MDTTIEIACLRREIAELERVILSADGTLDVGIAVFVGGGDRPEFETRVSAGSIMTAMRDRLARLGEGGRAA